MALYFSKEDVVEIGAFLRSDVARRTDDDQITLFKSLGIAREEIPFGKVIYERAVVGGSFGPKGV